MKPVVAVTAGCPCGIGPEVTVKALKDPRVRRALTPLVFGDASLKLESLRAVSELAANERRPGKPGKKAGLAQYAYLTAAIDAVKAGEAQAICTAPVSKEQITRAGVPFMGHTEVLAAAWGVEVLMLMDGPRVKVALATNHLALKDVPKALTVEGLLAKILLLARTLGPKRPKLAVCGLNPHAGEGGKLGREEVEIITPAIRLARRRGVDVQGPFPADGLFAKAQQGLKFDAVLAMFHDQGLVAAKALDFTQTVNTTLGLPIPRTSPDHGTAYDIAGKGIADPEPMVNALLRAAERVG